MKRVINVKKIFLVSLIVLITLIILSTNYLNITKNSNLPDMFPFGKNSDLNNISTSEILLYKKNENTLEMYNYFDDNQTLLTCFEKKEWGTWNILGWLLTKEDGVPAQKTIGVANGGSDWEYVFRVCNDNSKIYEFSGGSHGNEKLIDLQIIADDVNDLTNMKIGEKVVVNKVRIIEKTSLYLHKDISQDYCKVTRKYEIVPNKIIFEGDFNFTRNIYMGTSYVCMIPVSKQFGRHIKFIDTGNQYTTPPEGETLTTESFENFIGKEKTTMTKIWGDLYPNYKITTSIQNEDMVDGFNNELKVFYWDLNKLGNKLYFSKYDSNKTNEIIAGTQWKHMNKWEFIVEE